MEHNEDFQIRICSVTRKILQYSLLWPSQKIEMNLGKWYYIRITQFVLVTAPWCFALTAYIYTSIKNNIDVEIEDITMFFSMCGNYYGALIFMKNQPRIAQLLRDLSNFKTFGLPPGYELLTKKMNNGSRSAFIYNFSGISIWCLSKMLSRKECEAIIVETDLQQTCRFPSSIWIPFNVNDFPIYHLTYFYVFLSMITVTKVLLIVSFLMLEVVHHIVLRIKHLEVMIFECFQGETSYEIRKRKFKKCILYHQEILEFATRLNQCFSSEMFAHLTMTAAICACLEKQYINGQNKLLAVIHIIGWILTLFMACYGGQHLISSTLAFPDAIWSSDWCQAEVNLRKDVSFMILRSQKIDSVTAGPFSEVSYLLFISVMKMSYSIYCFLTQ